MRYTKLSNTDMDISVIGFGSWAIGKWAWSDVDDNNSVKTVHKALDMGINFFDTAPVYGFGHSEIVLSKALGLRRKDVFIATKVGLRWDEKQNIFKSLKKDSILKEIDDSLKRLNTDYVDLYQVHWPDEETPMEETFTTLSKIQQEGKARYIGVSNFSAKQIEEAKKYADIVSNQPPYSLLDRDIEKELIPYCIKNNIGILAYSPLAKALLTGKFNKDTKFSKSELARRWDDNFKGENFQKNLEIVEEIKPIAEKTGQSLTVLAISWVLKTKGLTCALCGAKRPDQIEENAKAGDYLMPDDVYQAMSSLTP